MDVLELSPASTKGRIPVKTRVVSESGRAKVYEEIRREIRQGGRAYVVLPLVEESEKLALRDAVRTADRLRELFPEVEVGLLHGRMKAEEKEAAMRAFKEGPLRPILYIIIM